MSKAVAVKSFVVNDVNVDRDAAILGCGMKLCLNRHANLYANYDCLVSENHTAHTAHAGVGGLTLTW